MKIECRIEEIELEGDFGMVDSIAATCTYCGHVTESFGTSEESTRRCLALMREECPQDDNNFYIEE